MPPTDQKTYTPGAERAARPRRWLTKQEIEERESLDFLREAECTRLRQDNAEMLEALKRIAECSTDPVARADAATEVAKVEGQ